jgi:hypothetical protein
MSSNVFQPVLRGLRDRENGQLSEDNDGRILIASRFLRDPSLAAKDDIHRQVLL